MTNIWQLHAVEASSCGGPLLLLIDDKLIVWVMSFSGCLLKSHPVEDDFFC